MRSHDASGDSRLSRWLRVREFAVPPSMIETATARRAVGDWAGACAAAGVDVDLHPRSVARTHGQELAALLRADLRHLAPDLLRWHMPRVAPDGLLRPGLTFTLARYDIPAGEGALHLVVRTPPAWADAGQRVSLALWDGSARSRGGTRDHPHPRPDRRFRLDLHRHLWDARRAGELRTRAGAGADPLGLAPPGLRCAVDRWAAEGGILLGAEGRASGTGAFTVRLGAGRRLVLALVADADSGTGPGLDTGLSADTAADADRAGTRLVRVADDGAVTAALPVLPDAATWVLPDLDLLQAGLIEADRLHPLVAAALVPGRTVSGARRVTGEAGAPRRVECRGAEHRIGLVDGVLAALDHDPDEIRREELLAALTGTPLPCLRAIDSAHRHPECLPDVRARLDHGDIRGALAVVEGLLGPDALLRNGDLRDELEAVALRRVDYGLFRAGLAEPPRGPWFGGGTAPAVPRRRRTRPLAAGHRRSRTRTGTRTASAR